MKVLLSVPLCLVCLVLTGCSPANTDISELNRKIDALENENQQLRSSLSAYSTKVQSSDARQQSNEVTFKQKENCQKHILAAKELLSNENFETEDGKISKIWYFRSIFYSESRGSCLVTAEQLTSFNGEIRPQTLNGLFDVLTGEFLMNSHDKDDFDSYLKDYQ